LCRGAQAPVALIFQLRASDNILNAPRQPGLLGAALMREVVFLLRSRGANDVRRDR